MSTRLLLGVAAIAVAACLCIKETVAQTVLYSDDFNNRTLGSGDPNGNPGGGTPGPGFSDWGMNNNALGGSLTFNYVVGADRGGGCNQVVDGSVGSTCNGIARTQTDILSMAPNGFSIGLDFQRDHQYNNLPGLLDPAGNGYMSIGLGNSSDPSNTNPDTNVNTFTDFTFLFQQEVLPNAGNTQFLQDGVLINPTASTDPGPIDYGDPSALHSVLITFVPQVASAYGDADVIDFTVVVDGDAVNKSFSSTVLGGDGFGTLSLSTNQAIHRAWDNLVVTALPVTSPVQGDYDGDGFVGQGDLDLVLLNWGDTVPPDPVPAGWVNQQPAGLIGQGNLDGVLLNWGNGTPPVTATAAVPEPATGLLLLVLAGAGLGGVRRRLA